MNRRRDQIFNRTFKEFSQHYKPYYALDLDYKNQKNKKQWFQENYFNTEGPIGSSARKNLGSP